MYTARQMYCLCFAGSFKLCWTSVGGQQSYAAGATTGAGRFILHHLCVFPLASTAASLFPADCLWAAFVTLQLFLYLVTGDCHANATLSTAHHTSKPLIHFTRSQLVASLHLHSCVLGVLASCGLTAAADAVWYSITTALNDLYHSILHFLKSSVHSPDES